MIDFGTIMSGIPKFKFGSATTKTGDIITQLLPYLFAIAGFALLLYIIYGGFKWMTSGGNPDKLKETQSILTNGLIGFLVIFVAYWLVQIVGTVFGLPDVGSIFK